MKPDLPLTIYDQRLLECARIVRETKTPFDMGQWECGSRHCAIGDYCTQVETDLKLIKINYQTVPELHGKLLFPAIAEHFGLSTRGAESLFGSHLRSDRAEVADRIERFVWERVGVQS